MSLIIISTFFVLVAGVIFIRKIFYSPAPIILQKIKNLKDIHINNTQAQELIQKLPAFWDIFETEIQNVRNYYTDHHLIEENTAKALNRLINYFPEPTIIVTPDAHISFANKSFSEEFHHIERGYSQPLLEVIREPELIGLFREETPEKVTVSREIKIRPQHSQIKKTYMVTKILYSKRDKDGKRNVLMIFHDITDIRRADQMKTDFIQNVSHELRTPLTSITGYLQASHEDLKQKDYKELEEHLGIIQQNVDRLKFLVQDLLQLSSLESDFELPLKSEDPQTLTQNVLKLFKTEFGPEGKFKVEDKYEVDSLYCDGRLVEQVLTNMLQNSLRYTPPGTQISIHWKQTPQNIELHYKDNGPGISAEHLPRLFERFFRVDPNRSRERGGTGLGLSIAKHIMQRHHGSIEVHSDLGKGIYFICSFKK